LLTTYGWWCNQYEDHPVIFGLLGTGMGAAVFLIVNGWDSNKSVLGNLRDLINYVARGGRMKFVAMPKVPDRNSETRHKACQPLVLNSGTLLNLLVHASIERNSQSVISQQIVLVNLCYTTTWTKFASLTHHQKRTNNG